MSTTRARTIGALFLIATIAYASGSALLPAQPIPGALLEFVDAIAVVAIGVLFFPMLQTFSPPVARTYLGARILEAILLSVSIASVFWGSAVWHDRAFQIAMLCLGAGSLPFMHVLYRTRLIPRSLSILGFIGYAALLLWALVALAGHDAGIALFGPGAVFEIAFPLWLIVKTMRDLTPSPSHNRE